MSSERRPLLSFVSILAALAALGGGALGCAYAGAGAHAFLGGGGGGGGGGGNDPPQVQVVDIPRADETTQSIHLRITDKESDPVVARLEFLPPSGSVAALVTAGPAVEGDGAIEPEDPFVAARLFRVRSGDSQDVLFEGPFTETPPIDTSPTGNVVILDWDWQQIGEAALDVTLRILLLGKDGKVLATLELVADKIGNKKPAVKNVQIVGDGGVVVARYEVTDIQQDVCSIKATFTIEGGPSDVPVADEAVVGGRFFGIVPVAEDPTKENENRFDFAWATDSSHQPETHEKDVRLVLTVCAIDDAGLLSAPASSPEVEIDNNLPPEIRVAFVEARAPDGGATVLFLVEDREDNQADVFVAFRGDDASMGEATPAGTSDPTMDVEPRTERRFDWLYPADGFPVDEAAAATLSFRVVDAGGDEGMPKVVDLRIGNTPPRAKILDVMGLQGGISIKIGLEDDSGDDSDLALTFTRPGGSAQKLLTGSATKGLLPGMYTIIWSSDAPDQAPDANGETIVVAVKATDRHGLEGDQDDEDVFVDNVGNIRPVVTLDPNPPDRNEDGAVTTGVLPIHFRIEDEDFSGGTDDRQTIEVLVTEIVAGPGFVDEPAALFLTGETMDLAPDGTTYKALWDFGSQFQSLKGRDVKLKVRSHDGAENGPFEETPMFRIGNSRPEITIVDFADGSGNLLVRFDVQDPDGDHVTIKREFATVQSLPSFDCDTTPFSTIENAAIIGGVLALEQVIAPTDPGETFDFTWSTITSLGITNHPFVFVRLTPCDEFLAPGPAVCSPPGEIRNDREPALQIVQVGFPKPVRGWVPIAFKVIDPDVALGLDPAQATATVTVGVETPNDAFDATGLVLGDFSATVPRPRPLGRARDFAARLIDVPVGSDATSAPVTTFLWDSRRDVGATPEEGTPATLRFQATNTLGGLEATAFLRVENPVEFEDGIATAAGDFTRELVVTDLTGDGEPDVAIANLDNPGAAIEVFRGEGDGTFTPLLSLMPSDSTRQLAVADLDGDRIPDIAATVFAPSPPGKVAVFLGNGTDRNATGTFTALPEKSVGTNTLAIAAKDLTGDGIVDLAVTQQSFPLLRILVGVGDGTFNESPLANAVGANPVGLAAVDFTCDGIPDIAVLCRNVDQLRLLQGDDDGSGVNSMATFTPLPTVSLAGGAIGLAAAEVTGDELLDFVVTSEIADTVTVVEASQTVSGVSFASQVPVEVGRLPHGVAVADITGDLRPEIVASNQGSGTVSILERKPSGRYEVVASPEAGDSPLGIAVLDLDRAGGTDIVVANSDLFAGGFTVLRGRHDIQFDVLPSDLPAGQEPLGIAALDMVHGTTATPGLVSFGETDVAVVDANSPAISIFRGFPGLTGAGDGTFELGDTLSVLTDGRAIVSRDLTGDGTIDLAVAAGIGFPLSPGGDLVTIFKGVRDPAGLNSSTTFTEVFSVAVPGATDMLGTLDANSDGIPDLVSITRETGNTVTVLLGEDDDSGKNSTGEFTAASFGVGGNNSHGIAAADVTLDGKDDLVVTSISAEHVEIYAGDGLGGFTLVHTILPPAPGERPTSVVPNDFTADGIPDLAVLANGASVTSPAEVRLFRGLGNGKFAPFAIATVGSVATPGKGKPLAALSVAAELSGDGLLDLAVADTTDETFTVLEGRGPNHGTARPPGRGDRGGGGQHTIGEGGPSFSAPLCLSIAAAEVAADGMTDLVVGRQGRVEIFSGAHGFPSQPFPEPAMGPPPAFGGEGRLVRAAPFDAAEAEAALDVPLAIDPMTGLPANRLSPASFALTVSPNATGEETAVTIELPLFSRLISRELNLLEGAFHVFRLDREEGRLVEVASTAPLAMTMAVVHPAAGTIELTTDDTGTFQVFLEVPRRTVTLYSDGFDDVAAVKGNPVPIPAGATTGDLWQIGPPPPPPPDDTGPVGPASEPNVLGTKLFGKGYRPDGSDQFMTGDIMFGTTIDTLTQRVVVRYDEWFRLDALDTTKLEVVPVDPLGNFGPIVPVAGAGHGPSQMSTGNAFVRAGPGPLFGFDITTLVNSFPAFRLRFQIDSMDSGLVPGDDRLRGWYIDNLKVVIEKIPIP